VAKYEAESSKQRDYETSKLESLERKSDNFRQFVQVIHIIIVKGVSLVEVGLLE
jgi:hypothetical protein